MVETIHHRQHQDHYHHPEGEAEHGRQGNEGDEVVATLGPRVARTDEYEQRSEHVGEIREKIIVLATKHLSRAGDEYQKISNLVSELKNTGVSSDDAYGMLGRMYGHKIIRANEFTTSVRTFNRPTHSEYGEGTLNTLYQAVTEACGEQPIQKRLHTLSKVTDFVRNESSKINNRFN